jgi:hypothetical protein
MPNSRWWGVWSALVLGREGGVAAWKEVRGVFSCSCLGGERAGSIEMVRGERSVRVRREGMS